MMVGKLLERDYPEQHYRTLFHQQTGFFVRKEEDGWPEPKWAMEGPELIDLSITNYCERGCAFCYREASKAGAVFITVNDVENVASQAAACGTYQIALGGGNPNQHPQFVEILRLIREKDIVPSYTTNGDGLTDDVLLATADYCGAMAVSVYAPYSEERYSRLLQRIKDYGIRVNLHAIIREETLEMWVKWLSEPPAFFRYVNALIFLNYKPIRGQKGLLTKERAKEFFGAVNKCQHIKVGFDSCSMSGIVQWVDTTSCLLEPCEAAKFSAFISEDLKMYPCSFMIGQEHYGDLRRESLLNIWQNNELFKKSRQDAKPSRCVGCQHYKLCKGGCRLFEEINFC